MASAGAQGGRLRSFLDRAAWYLKAAATIHVVRTYVAEFTVPIGVSMSPTFNHHGDIALVERLSVHGGRIRVGDVVVARSVQNVRHVVIKRVLGMEGDLVPVAGPRGRRYVTVPEGHVWLQGDNYHNSTDSRTYGPVPVAMVLGKVFYKAALLDEQQKERLELYLDTLFDWNERMNLIGRTSREEAWRRHIEDSLSLVPVIEECLRSECLPSDTNLLDVGSGAGLPGLVLAIARPTWEITLLDSLAKRVRFLEAAVAELGLGNVTVVCAKAEDAARQPGMRDAFPVVTARAVAETRILAELCLPFVAPGGVLVAPKGADPASEVRAAEAAFDKLGARVVGVRSTECVGPLGPRTVLLAKKLQPTPEEYPRRPGRPHKRPL